MQTVNIVAKRGDTYTHKFIYTDPATKNPIPIATGWIARFQVRKNAYSKDALVNYSTEDLDGKLSFGLNDGEIILKQEKEDTEVLPVLAMAYDLELTQISDGFRDTPVGGGYTVEVDVTRDLPVVP